MLEKIFDSPVQFLLTKAMDASSLRNEVIADNIANVDTPKYKRREVVFAENMKKALEKPTNKARLNVTNTKHIQIQEDNKLKEFQPEIRLLEDLSFRNDENNVDIDQEMALHQKNSINYNALSRSMSHEISVLRTAITGRG